MGDSRVSQIVALCERANISFKNRPKTVKPIIDGCEKRKRELAREMSKEIHKFGEVKFANVSTTERLAEYTEEMIRKMQVIDRIIEYADKYANAVATTDIRDYVSFSRELAKSAKVQPSFIIEEYDDVENMDDD
jgi:hypothetical protein